MKSVQFLLSFLLLGLFGSGARLVEAVPIDTLSIETVTIGNPGNPGDVQLNGTFGAVNYPYRIAKTEVTNAQYTLFLNAVAASDPNGLFDFSMGNDPRGGIVRRGSAGSFSYEVKPNARADGPGGITYDYAYAQKPAVFVSYLSAMRFVNWLENGQPTGLQGPTTTEGGVYRIGNGANERRAANASYFIPSEDEWYKAAYHQNDGVTGNYWQYPTAADSVPNNFFPTSDTGNSANFRNGPPTTTDFDHPLTDVGAYALSSSPYGTFDQGGNVSEWTEGIVLSNLPNSSDLRVYRGAGWNDFATRLHAATRNASEPSFGGKVRGFRIGRVIPEPSTWLLGLLISGGSSLCRGRTARRLL